MTYFNHLVQNFHNQRRLQHERTFWRSFNQGSPVRFYNFWKSQDLQDMWLYRFAKAHHSFSPDQSLTFVSTLGRPEVFAKESTRHMVFFTGENLHDRFIDYSDFLMNDPRVRLSIGFDCFDNDRYIRFPLWLLYNFEPESTDQQLVDRVRQLRYPDIDDKSRFCTMVASHDEREIRTGITRQIEAIHPVSCPGRLLHNDDSLLKDYNDDKMAYLRSFRFNICPENSNSFGYVTEKLFQAIDAGCVPVYWGSFNMPEPGIINPDAVLFFQPGADNADVLAQIRHLDESPEAWREFAAQPRLLPGAEDFVVSKFHELQTKLERVF